MQVSLVVPCYNGMLYISAFFEAIRRLDIPMGFRIDLLIVDNGSTDNSVKEIRQNLKVLPTNMQGSLLQYDEKKGSYAARNYAVGQTAGEVLVFTDIDCIMPANYFIILEKELARLPSSFISAGKVELFLSKNPNIYEYYDFTFGFNMQSYVKEKTGVTANAAIASTTFSNAKGFDEVESGGDRMFFKRVLNDKDVCYNYFPNLLVYHPCRNSYKELIKKAQRVGRGLAHYSSKQSKLNQAKFVVKNIIGAFIQWHQIKVIQSKKEVLKSFSIGKKLRFVGLIFWIGFYARIYIVSKVLKS